MVKPEIPSRLTNELAKHMNQVGSTLPPDFNLKGLIVKDPYLRGERAGQPETPFILKWVEELRKREKSDAVALGKLLNATYHSGFRLVSEIRESPEKVLADCRAIGRHAEVLKRIFEEMEA